MKKSTCPYKEPIITINDELLTPSQVLVIRRALQYFELVLQTTDYHDGEENIRKEDKEHIKDIRQIDKFMGSKWKIKKSWNEGSMTL
jgi:hypothetical protein